MARPTPEEIKDIREEPKKEKAYMDSLTSTTPAPKPAPKKMAKGGLARADGIARKGRTKGRMV